MSQIRINDQTQLMMFESQKLMNITGEGAAADMPEEAAPLRERDEEEKFDSEHRNGTSGRASSRSKYYSSLFFPIWCCTS